MANDRIYITGVTGDAYNRLEIRDFVQNEKFFSLYIQALQAMQNVNQDNFRSFFQVGGIHGLPYVPWDQSFGDTFAWGGYCTHGSVLFPTWHRPYVLLYEQVLQQHAVTIAATYTVDQDAWNTAAQQLRQPYWDWAKNSVPPPEVVENKRVTIIGPDGYRTVVDNPLYNYAFHPIDPSFPGPYSNWRTTLRRPTSRESTATDNVLQLEQVLRTAQKGITDDTYILLTWVNNWPEFSNHTTTNAQGGANSLESIHDKIHVLVGGAGQMGDPAVAGFDPIFYLHHCNVDRLLSLWRAINYDVWVTPGDSLDGTITIPPSTNVDTDTPLTPFWKEEDTYWPSSELEDTTKLGYTYPEFNGLEGESQEAIKSAILQRVDELYGDGVLIGLPTEATDTGDSSPVYDWFAHIEFKKYELGSSFGLLFFLGEVPDDPKQWSSSPNLVNSYYVFVNSAARHCANCRDQVDLVQEGFVRLNRGISRKLDSYESGKVEEYLKDSDVLNWRVQKTDGEPARLASLKVTIYRTTLKVSPHRRGGPIHAQPGKRQVVFKPLELEDTSV